MRQLSLSFDVVNRALVPFKGTSAILPDFRQTRYSARIYLVQPVSSPIPGSDSYEIFDASEFEGLRLGLWKGTTGTLGDAPALLLALADQLNWNLVQDDDGDDCWEGTLNCNTTQVETYLGGASSKRAYLAVNLTSGTELHEVYDHRGGTQNCTINSATDEFSGVAIDITAAVSTITLPLQIINPVNGHVFALSETSDGVLTWVWTNP